MLEYCGIKIKRNRKAEEERTREMGRPYRRWDAGVKALVEERSFNIQQSERRERNRKEWVKIVGVQSGLGEGWEYGLELIQR